MPWPSAPWPKGNSYRTTHCNSSCSTRLTQLRSRRLAFEWLTKIDPAAPGRLIPGFLNDPSLELRREAVARLITAGSGLVERAADNEQQRAAGIATLAAPW